MPTLHQPAIHIESGTGGPVRSVVGSGGSLDIESGGELDVESGASLKIAGTAMADTATLAAAAGSTNISEVTITVQAGGSTSAAVHTFDCWLSDAATGAGLTSTTASGTVTVKSASGVVIDTYTAKKALRVQTLATGVFILQITDSAKTGFYVCIEHPATGATIVSDQLVTGDYG